MILKEINVKEVTYRDSASHNNELNNLDHYFQQRQLETLKNYI